METLRDPGSTGGIEVPADAVGTVGVQRIKRIYGISFGFTHLLTVLILYMTHNDNVLERSFVEEQRGDRHQGIEPSSGLVYCLGDEFCRELLFEEILIFKGIMMLCERHGTGIEPAVDHLRNTVHLFAALRTLDGNGIDVRTVKLNILRTVIGHGLQLFNASDGMLMTTLTLPDVQRSSPVTVTADAPVLHIFQPVTETAFSDALGDPVYGVVVADEVVFHSRHFDEPGLTRIVNQRSIASPAMRVAVFKLRSGKEKASLVQVFQDHGICFLTENACPGSFRSHLTLGVYQLQERKVISSADFGVILTEGRSDMNNTGTITHGYIGIADNVICFFLQFLEVVERLILFVLQIFSFIGLQNLIGALAQNLVSQSLCQIINGSVFCFYLYIGLFRVYAESHVGGKRPGSRGPCQDVGILTYDFEFCDSGTFFDIFIALSHLMAGKRGTAARTVGNDLVALIEKTFLPDLFQSPPLRLDEVILVSNVRMLHVGPETNGVGEILPHAFVLPYALFTVFDKGLHSVLLDLLFSVQTQHFLYFQLYRKSVGIPACFTGNHFSLHRLVARDHVFDDTGLYVADVRFSVSGRRSVVEGVGLTFFTVVDTLLKDVVFFPEFFHFFLAFHKIHTCEDFVIHV